MASQFDPSEFTPGSKDSEIGFSISTGMPEFNGQETLKKADKIWDAKYWQELDDLAQECRINDDLKYATILNLIDRLPEAHFGQVTHLTRTMSYLAFSSSELFDQFYSVLQHRANDYFFASEVENGSQSRSDSDSEITTETEAGMVPWQLQFAYEALRAMSVNGKSSHPLVQKELRTREVIPYIVERATMPLRGQDQDNDLLTEVFEHKADSPIVGALEDGDIYSLHDAVTSEFILCLFEILDEHIKVHETLSPGVISNLCIIAGVGDGDNIDPLYDAVKHRNDAAIEDGDLESIALNGMMTGIILRYLQVTASEGQDGDLLARLFEWGDFTVNEAIASSMEDPRKSAEQLGKLCIFAESIPQLRNLIEEQFGISEKYEALEEDPQVGKKNEVLFHQAILELASSNTEYATAFASAGVLSIIASRALERYDHVMQSEAHEVIEECIFTADFPDPILDKYLSRLSLLTGSKRAEAIAQLCDKIADRIELLIAGEAEDDNGVLSAFIYRYKNIVRRSDVDDIYVDAFAPLVVAAAKAPHHILYEYDAHRALLSCVEALFESRQGTQFVKSKNFKILQDRAEQLMQERDWDTVIKDTLPGAILETRTEFVDDSRIIFISSDSPMAVQAALLGEALSDYIDPILIIDPTGEAPSVLSRAYTLSRDRFSENLYVHSMLGSSDHAVEGAILGRINGASLKLGEGQEAHNSAPNKTSKPWKKLYRGAPPDIVVLNLTPDGRLGVHEKGDDLSVQDDYQGKELSAKKWGIPLPEEYPTDSVEVASYGLKTIYSAGKLMLVASDAASIEHIKEVLKEAEVPDLTAPIRKAMLHVDVLIVLNSSDYEDLFGSRKN